MEVDLNTVGDGVLTRIRGEYREMPGLKLTMVQARRLWDLDASTCDTLLATLVQSGFLRRTADGGFILVDSR